MIDGKYCKIINRFTKKVIASGKILNHKDIPVKCITFDNKYLPKTYYENESAFEYDIDPHCYNVYSFAGAEFYNMPGYSYELVPES